MSAILPWLDVFWCLTCFGALEAYALGTWMRRHEERTYAKQQEARAYKAALRRR